MSDNKRIASELCIKKITPEDRAAYMRLSDEFYSSAAVSHTIPEEYREATFAELIRQSPYLEGYLFMVGEKCAGYALLAHSFSTETGSRVIWIEELFVSPSFSGQGIGSIYLNQLIEACRLSKTRLRLEVEPNNPRAARLYERLGFSRIGYEPYYMDNDN